jgi:hypothetical protein
MTPTQILEEIRNLLRSVRDEEGCSRHEPTLVKAYLQAKKLYRLAQEQYLENETMPCRKDMRENDIIILRDKIQSLDGECHSEIKNILDQISHILGYMI